MPRVIGVIGDVALLERNTQCFFGTVSLSPGNLHPLQGSEQSICFEILALGVQMMLPPERGQLVLSPSVVGLRMDTDIVFPSSEIEGFYRQSIGGNFPMMHDASCRYATSQKQKERQDSLLWVDNEFVTDLRS